MTTPKPWRVIEPHIDDCRAGEAPFQTVVDEARPWDFRNFAANRGSARGSYYLYLRVRCNDPRCSAIAVVHLATALKAVGLNR